MNKNSKKSGLVRVITFPFKGGYRSVCLDFDIVKDGNDLNKLREEMQEAIEGYIENVIKNNLSDNLLNRRAEKKYWKIFEEYCKFASSNKNNNFPAKIRKSSVKTIPMSELVSNFSVSTV